MVVVPIHRVTRRLLAVFAVTIALVAFCLFLGQIRHVYHQHLKFRRFEGYNKYVDVVTKQLEKLETLANQSSLSLDQFSIMFRSQSSPARQYPNNTEAASNFSDHLSNQ